MRIKRIIGELCILKHRASASANERKAAEHIYHIMRNIGLIAKIEEFRSQQRMTWELVTIMGLFVAEVVVYFFVPIGSLAIGLIAAVLFWGYFTNQFKPLAPLFRHALSCNVIGRLNNPHASYKIIFTAHHDTARSGPLWNPKAVANFRLNFLIELGVLILLQILVLLKIFSIDAFIFKLLVLLSGIYVLGNIAVLLIAGLWGELVQGASDNASGVAVMLDLAARLKELSFPQIEFWFVSTGSEEVGAVGMAHFMKSHADDLSKENCYFINFDNLGAGTPHYFLGEGMLNFYRFSPDLIAAAEAAAQQRQFSAITPAKYRLAYTDAIVPAGRGYHAMLLLALDDRELIPNWHWPSDMVDNIDLATPQLAADFALEMVKKLDDILQARTQKRQTELGTLRKELAAEADDI